MLTHIRPAIVMMALFTILCGGIYPYFITGVAQVAFPSAANGSLVSRNGAVVGSALIGQNFTSDKYFQGRPSATTGTDPNDATKTIAQPYNADNSTGSNLGPTAKPLVDRVTASIADLRKQGVTGDIPADAVTTSASGLDPDITPADAAMQVARVAKARNLPGDQVRSVLDAQTSGRLFGVIGEPHVNVLALNLALDATTTK
ncbi:potassium-transporting ATPase KdpC subunit [Labrys miyagiensis]|uniref:Potassium-transporting ATPase KdpC subunit n=1 Tax=Labrys miyagiensis TaxID=346912 RepID=A0ABQ6CJU2_9HYPH|nr:potassium-transporting ATPase subunit KdpC [Labrys miyagiensis]GLS20636.1 potassium-transporting ATPase KdpC subunit [Labrys miyagiensis]